jgi:hypothetical protein
MEAAPVTRKHWAVARGYTSPGMILVLAWDQATRKIMVREHGFIPVSSRDRRVRLARKHNTRIVTDPFADQDWSKDFRSAPKCGRWILSEEGPVRWSRKHKAWVTKDLQEIRPNQWNLC